MYRILETLALVILIKSNICAQTLVDSREVPYSSIVKLLIYSANSVGHGTGVILNDNYILTNAHNIYDLSDASYVDSIRIISGYDESDSSLADIMVLIVEDSTTFVDTNYTKGDSPSLYDFAIVKIIDSSFYRLVTDNPYHKEFKFEGSIDLSDMDLYISGYPWFRFFEIWRPWGAKRQYVNSTKKYVLGSDNLLNYRLNTRKGNSGSPLWVIADNEYTLVGIHTSGFLWCNHGIYFDSHRFSIINKWINGNTTN